MINPTKFSFQQSNNSGTGHYIALHSHQDLMCKMYGHNHIIPSCYHIHRFQIWFIFNVDWDTQSIPVCTRSPTCSSDMVTDFPFSRYTLAEEGKQPSFESDEELGGGQ